MGIGGYRNLERLASYDVAISDDCTFQSQTPIGAEKLGPPAIPIAIARHAISDLRRRQRYKFPEFLCHSIEADGSPPRGSPDEPVPSFLDGDSRTWCHTSGRREHLQLIRVRINRSKLPCVEKVEPDCPITRDGHAVRWLSQYAARPRIFELGGFTSLPVDLGDRSI